MSSSNQILGERLRIVRERRELSQLDVQRNTTISNKSLSRYETGKAAPDPNTLADLCRFYDVSANYILGLTDVMSSYNETVGTSKSKSIIMEYPELLEKLISLSPESREKAVEYITLLKTYEVVKADNNTDVNKKG